ncbi:hypothetical protein EAF00_000820 [Botryotinia globosa]|nr:hypothetical protein EAF00_000820 [Botryotinia globosa]
MGPSKSNQVLPASTNILVEFPDCDLSVIRDRFRTLVCQQGVIRFHPLFSITRNQMREEERRAEERRAEERRAEERRAEERRAEERRAEERRAEERRAEERRAETQRGGERRRLS